MLNHNLFIVLAFVYHLSTVESGFQIFIILRSFASNYYELEQAGFFSNHNGLAKNLIENKLRTCL